MKNPMCVPWKATHWYLTLFILVACATTVRAQDGLSELPPLDDLLPTSESFEAAFQHYPPVDKVVEAALDALPKSLQGAKSWLARQRIAALLPIFKMGLQVQEGNYDRYLLERDPKDKNRLDDYTIDDGRRDYDRNYFVVSWDLAEFVFNSDELEAAEKELEIAGFRLRLTEKVVNTYGQLKAAALQQAREGPVQTQDSIELAMEIETYAALLDAYTDGYFGEYVEQSKKWHEKGHETVPRS